MKTIKFLSVMFCAASLLMSCSSSCGDANSDQACTSDAVIENIMTRTSIRQFTSQPVSNDTLDMLVKAGMAAPSAVNAQPWAFVVVTDREKLDSLDAVHHHANLKTATAAIIVCGNMQKAMEGKLAEYWVQDCSAATENILLAAHACGLGAVWCGVYPNEAVIPGVKRVLELPEYIMPLNIITMGYPAEQPAPKDKFKEENVHYQKW